MPDLLDKVDRADRRIRRKRRLARAKAPLALMSLAVIPAMVSFRVYPSVQFAGLVAALTGLSIGVAAIALRPR